MRSQQWGGSLLQKLQAQRLPPAAETLIKSEPMPLIHDPKTGELIPGDPEKYGVITIDSGIKP
jgi:hypothetical protein